MCHILKTDGCLGLVVLGVTYVGHLHVLFFEFSLVSSGALCKISSVKIFNSFHLIFGKHDNRGGVGVGGRSCYFFDDLPN